MLDEDVGGSGGERVSRDRAKPMLVSLSDLYLLLDSISVGVSEPSLCLT